jgi:hypothetical protein
MRDRKPPARTLYVGANAGPWLSVIVWLPCRIAKPIVESAFCIDGDSDENSLACLNHLLAVLCMPIFPALAAAQTVAPDLILYNGKVFTSTAAHPYVQAIAIHGERIVATSDSAKIP